VGGGGGELTEGGFGRYVEDSDDPSIVSTGHEPPVGGAKHTGIRQAIQPGKGLADFGYAAAYRHQG